jgi:hypothetical protein
MRAARAFVSYQPGNTLSEFSIDFRISQARALDYTDNAMRKSALLGADGNGSYSMQELHDAGLAGKSFQLKSDILGIKQLGSVDRAFTIPSGSVIQVTNYPCSNDHRMAEAFWDGRSVLVFGRDVQLRAEEIESAGDPVTQH